MNGDTAIGAIIGAGITVTSTLNNIDLAALLLNVDLIDAIFKIGITAVAAIVGGFLGALGKHFFYKWVLKRKPKK